MRSAAPTRRVRQAVPNQADAQRQSPDSIEEHVLSLWQHTISTTILVEAQAVFYPTKCQRGRSPGAADGEENRLGRNPSDAAHHAEAGSGQ